MTDQEKRDALAAAGILQNDVFLGALARLDERYVSAWRTARDTEEREACWHRQAILREFEAELFNTLQSAAVAACGRDEEIKAALTTVQNRRRRKNG